MSGVRQHTKEQLPQVRTCAPSTPRSPFAVTHCGSEEQSREIGGRRCAPLQHHCLGTPWRFLDYFASERKATHTCDTGSGHPLHDVASLAPCDDEEVGGQEMGSLRPEGVTLLERTALRHARKIDKYPSDMRAGLLHMFPLARVSDAGSFKSGLFELPPRRLFRPHHSERVKWGSLAGRGTDFPSSSDKGVSRRKALLPVIFFDAVLIRRPRRRLCLYSNLRIPQCLEQPLPERDAGVYRHCPATSRLF
ncbi:hypothetical protein B0H13DRAFT_2665741 [Mycena leptocephala]|nr:hypothetical protein B0H13DRAFT_2665741 [Mycena leptocephala]